MAKTKKTKNHLHKPQLEHANRPGKHGSVVKRKQRANSRRPECTAPLRNIACVWMPCLSSNAEWFSERGQSGQGTADKRAVGMPTIPRSLSPRSDMKGYSCRFFIHSFAYVCILATMLVIKDDHSQKLAGKI